MLWQDPIIHPGLSGRTYFTQHREKTVNNQELSTNQQRSSKDLLGAVCQGSYMKIRKLERKSITQKNLKNNTILKN